MGERFLGKVTRGRTRTHRLAQPRISYQPPLFAVTLVRVAAVAEAGVLPEEPSRATEAATVVPEVNITAVWQGTLVPVAVQAATQGRVVRVV